MLVSRSGDVPVPRHGQESGMFAGAIVVAAAWASRRALSSLLKQARSAAPAARRPDRSRCSRSATARPRRASVCIGSPECEAQASATSSSLEPERLRRARFDQRQRLDRLERGARIDRRFDVAQREFDRASASAMAIEPRWTLSTSAPRVTSTRMGLAKTMPSRGCRRLS